MEPVPTTDDVVGDQRGQASEVMGRKIRRYTGTSRPPHILPELWRSASKRQKRDTIDAYLASLPPGAVARLRESDVPAMPLEEGAGGQEHRPHIPEVASPFASN